jgi:cell division protein FtsN
MFASRASTGISIGLLASLLGALPAAALTQKECSEKYQAAKATGTLGDKSWSDFRKECAANGATTTTAPDTKPAAAKEPEKKPTKSAAKQAVFPSAVSSKYAKESAGRARMHTCLAQYNANKATNANGGLKWIMKGDGYYSACNKRLKS